MARHESTVHTCRCTHPGQDALYGPGKRLHNQTKNGRRCTACGTDTLGGGFADSGAGKARK